MALSTSDFIGLGSILVAGIEVPMLTFLGFLLKRMASFNKEVTEKLQTHDTALAVLIQQVNPPGDKSLRSILSDIQIKQAMQRGATTAIHHEETL